MNCLTAHNNSHEKGAHLNTMFNNGLNGQQWEFTKVMYKENRYYIRNGFGMFLDVAGAKSHKGTPVIQYDFNGKKNQIWHIVPVHH